MSTTNLILSGSNSGSLGIPSKPWTAVYANEFHGDGSNLTGITGTQGPAGPTGADGDSAYDTWLANGNTGTEQEFLNSLVGLDGATGPAGATGADGDSAYETWLDEGNSGTQQDFLDSLVGPTGPQGPAGSVSGSVDMGGTMTAHIIPDSNAAYDLGNAEYKIRHLFLSDNSLWVGDEHKISIGDDGKMKFRKRKNVLPKELRDRGVPAEPGASLHRIEELAAAHGLHFENLFQDADDFDEESDDVALAALQDQINALGASIPDVSGLATKAEIPDISNLATVSQIPDVSNLATVSQIPDVSNLATTAEVPTNVSELTNDAGYLTEVGTVDYNSLSNTPDVSAMISTAVDGIVDGAPGALDTLNEIAAAIADDANIATTLTTAISTEQARAEAAEQTNATAISAEEAARIAADNALDDRIDNLSLDSVSGDFSVSGRVAIGTTTDVDSPFPQAGLHINVDPGGTTPQLFLDGGGGDGGDIAWPIGESLQVGTYEVHPSNPNLTYFYNRLHITSPGDVGIGTTNPSSKLDVDGTITATSFAGNHSAGSIDLGNFKVDGSNAAIGTSINSNYRLNVAGSTRFSGDHHTFFGNFSAGGGSTTLKVHGNTGVTIGTQTIEDDGIFGSRVLTVEGGATIRGESGTSQSALNLEGNLNIDGGINVASYKDIYFGTHNELHMTGANSLSYFRHVSTELLRSTVDTSLASAKVENAVRVVSELGDFTMTHPQNGDVLSSVVFDAPSRELSYNGTWELPTDDDTDKAAAAITAIAGPVPSNYDWGDKFGYPTYKRYRPAQLAFSTTPADQLGYSDGAVEVARFNHQGSLLLNKTLAGNPSNQSSYPKYGRLEVHQSSNASDQGIAVENSSAERTVRLWVDSDNNACLDAGGAGNVPLTVNRGGGTVVIGNSKQNTDSAALEVVQNGTGIGQGILIYANKHKDYHKNSTAWEDNRPYLAIAHSDDSDEYTNSLTADNSSTDSWNPWKTAVATITAGRHGSSNWAGNDTTLEGYNGHTALAFRVNGTWGKETELMRLTGEGRIGIKTTKPEYTLDVAEGTTRLNKAYFHQTSGETHPVGIKANTSTGLAWFVKQDNADDYWSCRYNRSGNHLDFKWFDEGSDDSNDANASGGYITPNSSATMDLMNFTGQHRCLPSEGTTQEFSQHVGKIVASTGDYKNFKSDENREKPNINQSLPRVELTTAQNQKSSFGVVSGVEDPNTGREYSAGNFVSTIGTPDAGDERVFINSVGEGAVWVTNINGNLENGDYITTCEIPGYGMLQDDDLLHNYTVAKITMDCDFDLNSDKYECVEVTHNGQTYKAAFVGCTYHCG